MKVGVTDPGRGDAHQRLAGVRLLQLQGLDLERAAGLVQDGGAGLDAPDLKP